MPNCNKHEGCDLICSWDGYYCHNEAHKWQWKHVRQPSPTDIQPTIIQDDMPDDVEDYYNERAERMP